MDLFVKKETVICSIKSDKTSFVIRIIPNTHKDYLTRDYCLSRGVLSRMIVKMKNKLVVMVLTL